MIIFLLYFLSYRKEEENIIQYNFNSSSPLGQESHDTPEEVTISLEDALQSEKPRKRTRQRLKSKMAQRKSLRRTLKSGITEEDMVAAGIK